ncbi:nuclear transport factor 2 family protein [Flavobacterium sp.]|uniref:nuclear transport factor 2 family protein n=1 Tax=Flavobacterium sp. TaxID=239 RepID=UPI00263840D2|nr:nuclear transport factor 2 family protein [Flavobacterium sp.]MDG2432581.1 nuclear transport factor 2 family protein [Flavobacterium sp.]
MNRHILPIYLIIILFTASCALKKETVAQTPYKYAIENQQLYDVIIAMDSTFFDAYNNCDMNKQAGIYADSLEFYHDQGGLMTSKQEVLDGTKKNICGKVTRELIAGSIEVYPIKGYGAVEIGLHKFHNNQELAGTPSKTSKFIIMWQLTNKKWRIAKVISLH